MSTAFLREARRPRVSSTFLVVVALVAIGAGPSDVRAQAQDSAQQKCLSSLYKSAAKVGQTQGKANGKCLKARQTFALEQLGNPDQERTLDACLTNDSKGQ